MLSDSSSPGSDVQLRRRLLALSLFAGVILFLGLTGGWWLGHATYVPPAAAAPAAPLMRDSRPEGSAKAVAALAPREDLYIFGTLIGAELYQTFQNIGLLADAAEHGLYPEADCTKRLKTILHFMDRVDQQMGGLSKTGLEEEQAQKVAECRAISALLRTQATELLAYWDTPPKDRDARKEHETRYRKAKADAWAALKEMLAINE